jgi:hypothetical protein
MKTCFRWSFDAIFDLAAFHCVLGIRPFLDAQAHERVLYDQTRVRGRRGMKIDVR